MPAIKNKFIILLILFSLGNICIAQKFVQIGYASYYGNYFQGKRTANGERYNMHSFTAAHKQLPFNSFAKVTHLKNGKSVIVRITDRGPYKKSRVIDLSKAAAEAIGLVSKGVGKVKVELLDSADIEKSERFMLSKDCCYTQTELVNPVGSYDIYGNLILTDGDNIQEIKNNVVFSEQYIKEELDKIEIALDEKNDTFPRNLKFNKRKRKKQ